MLAYLDGCPDTDAETCAATVADILLSVERSAAIHRSSFGRAHLDHAQIYARVDEAARG